MNVQGLGGFNTAQVQQKLFQQADADKSGGVSLEELKSLKAPPGAPQGVNLDEVFASSDADGDGVLSQSELKPPPFGNASGLSGEALAGLFNSNAEQTDGTSALLELLSSSSSSNEDKSSSSSLVDFLKEISENANSNLRSSGSEASQRFSSSVGDLYQQLLSAIGQSEESTSSRVFA